MAQRANAIADDLTCSELERAYMKSDLADKWMRLWAPRLDKMQGELNEWKSRCQIALDGAINEYDTAQLTSGGEIRSFLRTLDEGKRDQLAEANPKFAAAAAAQPQELSGVRAEIYARCIEATQQPKLPDRYADLQDYKAMSIELGDLGKAMLRNVHEMMALRLMEKRYERANIASRVEDSALE